MYLDQGPPQAALAHGLRIQLAAGLRDRREELETSVTAKVFAVSDPTGLDPAHADGLRTAVAAALDFALRATERGDQHTPAVPPVLITQARLAAYNGIPLGTVLRRYFAGYLHFGDFLAVEATRAGQSGSAAHADILREQAVLFERLIAVVSEEYAHELTSRMRSAGERRVEAVERLLAGGSVEQASNLTYSFENYHLGLIAVGVDIDKMLRRLAGELDRRLLIIPRDEEVCWAWFGGRRPVDSSDVKACLPSAEGARPTIAVGESAHGLVGWRFTHRQAAAALPVAISRGKSVICYADVALDASILRDELLVTSLRVLFLEPLSTIGRDHGVAARNTLRAYFATGRNVSSAAAALRISRNTVASRINAIEAAIGRDVNAVSAELEIALRLVE